jgi:hypothetical protein
VVVRSGCLIEFAVFASKAPTILENLAWSSA